MSMPRFHGDPAFKMLRMGDIDAFHEAVTGRATIDFSECDLRGVDFRKVDLSNFVLHDAYLRDADFRGCDLRHLDLAGVSMHGAKIGGTYFPDNVSASEIRMSLRHGTRIRPCQNP
ncbi:MAG: pentapeptide repeat-containing protein [Pirellulales bacterium]